MDKEDVIHMYYRVLFSHLKEWNYAICSNMNEPGDYHTKWSKSDRERHLLHDISVYVGSKKMIQVNLFTKETQIQRTSK